MPIVTLLGLAGNVLSILVLRSPGIDMKVSALACSVLPESWNFASKLGEPMRIGMIGPQTKKNCRPINDRIPAIFVFNGNFNG